MFASDLRVVGTRSSGGAWKRRAAIVVIGLAGLGTTGCNNAGEGAVSGGVLGALGGMAIGSLTGDMGKGAVIGAVLGGLGGLFVGDQNQRNDSRGR